MMKSDEYPTIIDVPAESSAAVKGNAPLIGARNVAVSGGYKRGVAITDFLFRLGAVISALSAAGTMGTSDETLPFFTQFFQFQASYDDIQTFTFFVVVMAIVGCYLVLSIPFSIITIIRPYVVAPRLLLLVLDTVALTLTTAAGSAAAAIVYLAHNGNTSTNWLPICQQFGDFCQKTTGAVIASMVTVVVFVILVILSAFALRQH